MKPVLPAQFTRAVEIHTGPDLSAKALKNKANELVALIEAGKRAEAKESAEIYRHPEFFTAFCNAIHAAPHDVTALHTKLIRAVLGDYPQYVSGLIEEMKSRQPRCKP